MKVIISCLLLSVLLIVVYASTTAQKESVLLGHGTKFDTPVIGIDLGTTYSCVAVYRDGNVEVIPNEQGNRITPSVVSWNAASGEKLIGEAAKNNAPFNPKNTLYDVKRLIGRRYNEVLRKDAKLFSYDLTNKDGRVYVKVHPRQGEEEKVMSPEEISAMVLIRMKQIAEKYLDTPVKHAVVTVPAYFNDQQRQATKDAGKIAGLNIVRIVNEPTSAAMAYGLGLYAKKEENVLVFDLGGGTFDVSLLTLDNGVFQVIATSGDTHLGGEDFDLRLVEHLVSLFKKKYPEVDEEKFKADQRSFQRLKAAAENAKRTLSTEVETQVEIESLFDGKDFSERITRAAFEKVNMDLFQKTLDPVKRVLSDSNMEKDEIDEVILVGGSTRIPKVQELLKKFFDGKELNKSINPDEAVAYGAAVQAAILSRAIDDVVLIDVTPLSLGIETQGGVMATIIPRNTPIPAEKSDTFTTTEDYQDRLTIPIYEGERKMTKFNRLLGELKLSGIPPAPRGIPQIKVTFQLDQNGILKVIAEDQATKNRKEMEIVKGTLSADEVDKMTEDAEKNSQEDIEFIERSQEKQKMESYISNVQSQIATLLKDGKINSEDEKTVKEKLKSALSWLKRYESQATKDKISKSFASLRKVIDPVIAKAYGGKVTDTLDLDDVDVEDATRFDDDDQPYKHSEDDEPIHDEL